MAIFVFEAVTAGLPGYEMLASEGVAMVNELARHLQRTLGAEVCLLCSPANRALLAPCLQTSATLVGVNEIAHRFTERCENADAIVVIAPELDDELSRWVERAMPYEHRLWTPKQKFAQAASDKWQTAALLRAARVATPPTILLQACGGLHDGDQQIGNCLHAWLSESIPFPKPWVVKPRFGAGSVGIQVIADHPSERQWLGQVLPPDGPETGNSVAGKDWLIQPLLKGDSVSVTVISGRHGSLTLPACRQLLSCDGSFQYTGGAFPVEAELSDLARATAAQAVRALPDSWGLCGVDLVVCGPESSRFPMVVDINPRVTTSVIGHCQALVPHFATVWADVMLGRNIEPPAWRIQACQFSSQGTFARSANGADA